MVNERIRPTGYRVSSKLIKHGRERSVQIRARNALINMEIYSKIWCARAYFRGVSCVKVTRNDFSNGDAIATSVAFFSRTLSCYRMRAIRFHKDAGEFPVRVNPNFEISVREDRGLDHEGTRPAQEMISLIKRDEETPRQFPLAIFHASWQRHAIQKFNILIETSSSILVTCNGIGAVHFHLLLSRCIETLALRRVFF